MSVDPLVRARLTNEPGPAEPLSAPETHRAVERALAAAGYGQLPVAARVRGRRPWWPAAFALGFAATAAAGYTTRGFGAFPAAQTVSARPHPTAEARPRPGLAVPAPTTAPQAISPEPDPPASSPAPALTSPSDRLKLANTLRKQGRFADAASIYASILREMPSSKEAYVARVAAADLKLEKLGDAGGALALYTAAHQGGGYLAAQAHWGIAASHRALGQQREEARTLQDIVALYPPGLLRTRAETRLHELGSR